MADPKFTAIDTSTGAPKKVRAIVGNFDDPTRRLEAIKQYYPDAVSTSGTPMGEDNFIYTNPATGQRTLYNPKGFDMGDVVSVGRDIVSGVAGGFGGAAALVGGQLGPQVATPEEFYTVPAAAALASEGAGQLYDRAVDAFLPEPFSVDRGGLVEQGTKAATNIGMEIVGGKLVEKGIDALKAVPGAVTRKISGINANRETAARARLAEANDFDMQLPSAGTAAQSPFLMFLEQRMRDLPTGQAVIFERFNNFRLSSAQAVQDISAKYGRAYQEGGEIGNILQTGVEKGVAKFKLDQGKLYDIAYDMVPGASGRLNNIIELRETMIKDLAKAPESLMPSMKAALDEIERLIADSQSGGGIDLSTLRQLRTNLRRKTDGMTKQGGGDAVSYLKTVYRSLTDDMNEAVVNAGGEDAKRALKKADIYTANRTKFDVEPVYDQLHKNNKNSVQAFSFLIRGTKESGEQIKKILRNIPAAQRGDIQASLLSRLGTVSPAGQDAIEEFSTARFIQNYSKLADSSKDALFGGSQNRAELDKLVKLFDDVKSTDAFANNSRTGQTIGFTATLSPLLAFPLALGQGVDVASASSAVAAGMAMTTVAPYVTSRLLTNPIFVKWLVKAGPQMGRNPNSVGLQLGRLMEISSRDSQFREDAMDYINAFGQAFAPSAAEAATIEQPVEEVDVSTSPALQSLIETTNPDLLRP